MINVKPLIIALCAQLIYSFTFIQLRQGQTEKRLKQLRDKGLSLDIFGCQYLFALTPRTPLTSQSKFCRKSLSVFAVISTVFACVLPIFLGITIAGTISDKQLPFSFKIPNITLQVVVSFLLASILHEAGHAAFALANRSPISGVGLGLRLMIPQFFVKIDEEDVNSQKKIAAGGFIFNLGAALTAIALSWLIYGVVRSQQQLGVSVLTQSATFKQFDSITELAGVKVKSKEQYQQLIKELRASFYANAFVFDENSKVNLPSAYKPSSLLMGAKKISGQYQLDPNGGHSILSSKFLNGQQINFIQPARLTVQAQIDLEHSSQYCSSSGEGTACVLPSQKQGAVRFYVSTMINKEMVTIATDFEELENLHVMSGAWASGSVQRMLSVVGILALFAAANLGIGILALAPFPTSSDGSYLVSGVPKVLLRSAVGVELVALVVTVVVKQLQ